MLLNGDVAPLPGQASSSSVKLRRRGNRSGGGNITNNGMNSAGTTPDPVKRKNRHSGDFFHWSPSRQLQEERKAMRKSGDWSYVGFPTGGGGGGFDSGNSTPNKRPSPISENAPPAYTRQPGSLLESKVIASIMKNEGNGSGITRSAHGSPARPSQSNGLLSPNRCTSAMETLDRKPDLGNGPHSTAVPGSSGVSRKRISENTYSMKQPQTDSNYSMLQPPRSMMLLQSEEQPHSSFYMNPMADQDCYNSNQTNRRSQSQGREGGNKEKVTSPTQKTPNNRRQKGLGRRSATQMEISRKNQARRDSQNWT
jgi:hypothetical protein